MNEKTVEVIQEHKSSRLPGERRDVLDCYLQEIEQVWACLISDVG